MGIEEFVNAVSNAQITVLLLFLWWFERKDRQEAEKRERNVLRSIAEEPPEE